MKNYKMTIQYDGTRYSGWQRQTNTDKSIQGKIEDVLSKMCNHKVEIHGSGRTDAGVHAVGQVASFKIETQKETCEIMEYLNLYLPEDIAVVKLTEADERFHARLNAKEKTYVYTIHNSSVRDVFRRKYVYNIPKKLDAVKIRDGAKLLLGKHDFLGFSSVKKVKKSTVRTIYDIEIKEEGEDLKIFFTGDGFLYNMVRIITGTLIEIGLGEREVESITYVLESKNREKAGFTAPGCGLVLYQVKY